MSDSVDVKKALRVAYKILSEGIRDGDEHRLSGLVASTDFDGYTVILRNDYVSLSIYFHSKFSFEFLNEKEKQQFLDKIDTLDGVTESEDN